MDLRVLRGGLALLVLAGLATVGVVDVLPPSPRGADAPPGDFSAARAAAHNDTIGAKVHVAGSPAAADVREHLVSTLRGLGLTPQVQDTVGRELSGSGIGGGGDAVAMARVRNVVARVEGTAPTGRLILLAHYDSVQVSHGGSDDGAGVTALLETARAVAAGPRPRNDIVFLFTDAEEACLCGAEAFVREHPLAAGGGVVLNFEARGSSGPPIMFETSRGNAGLVRMYGDAVPHPVATSFAVEIYRILPNDTDFSVFLAGSGFTGLNAAFIDGSAVYHTPLDTPANLDRRSLQAHGDNALALARAFGDADLTDLARPGGSDATYFPLPGVLVRYPGWLIWPLAVAALAAVAALGWLSRRRGLTSGRRLAGGFGLALIPLVAAPVLAQVLWAGSVALRPGWANMIDPWRPLWLRCAVIALAALTLFIWYGLSRRLVGAVALAVGGLGWLAVLGAALAWATPGGAYLGTLPALAGALAGLVALAVRPPVARVAAVTVGAGLAVLILAPTVYLFFPALGLALGAAPVLLATMAGLALLPLFDDAWPRREGERTTRRRWLAAVPCVLAGALVVAFGATALAVDRFDATHPQPAQLMYALDADDGRAWWASTESEPGEWTGRHVSGAEDLTGRFPVLDAVTATGPAQAASLPAPAVEVVADSTVGARRSLTVRVRPQRPVRLVYLAVATTADLTSAVVAGREVAARDGRFGVLFHAPPAEGVEVTFTVDGGDPIELRTMDGSDGLDGLPGFVPRPPAVGVLGSHGSELVVVAKTHRL